MASPEDEEGDNCIAALHSYELLHARVSKVVLSFCPRSSVSECLPPLTFPILVT